MFVPKKIDVNKQETATDRLLTAFTAIAILATTENQPGKFEGIAMNLEDARAVLIWVGFHLPPMRPLDSSISATGIGFLSQSTRTTLQRAKLEGGDMYRMAFVQCAASVSQLLATDNIAGIIARREESIRENTVSDDARGLLRMLIDIEDTFGGTEVAHVSQRDFATHGRLTHTLERFHRLTPAQLANVAHAMRRSETPLRNV